MVVLNFWFCALPHNHVKCTLQHLIWISRAKSLTGSHRGCGQPFHYFFRAPLCCLLQAPLRGNYRNASRPTPRAHAKKHFLFAEYFQFSPKYLHRAFLPKYIHSIHIFPVNISALPFELPTTCMMMMVMVVMIVMIMKVVMIIMVMFIQWWWYKIIR